MILVASTIASCAFGRECERGDAGGGDAGGGDSGDSGGGVEAWWGFFVWVSYR